MLVGVLMKAMVLTKIRPVNFRPLTLEDIETPQPAPGQIRVKVNVCGVCHTDLHTVEGELGQVPLPIVPGHQVVGVVDAVNGKIKGIRVGDRVGVAWLHHACGACPLCRRGDENLCRDARFTGYDVRGGYAEFMTVDPAFTYKLPSGASDEHVAPLLCAGIIGYRALRLSGVQPGGRVGLYGFGASAHIAIQIATYWKCRVYAFSRSESHRALAARLGAVWTGESHEFPPDTLDAGVVFAPVGPIVPQAMAHLDRGGTLALAGIYMTQIPPLDYEKHLYYERGLRSVTAATRRDGQELLKLAAKIPIRTAVRTYPLEQANEALLDLKEGRINGAAVLTLG